MLYCKTCILDLPKTADKSDKVDKVHSCMPTVFRNILFSGAENFFDCLRLLYFVLSEFELSRFYC